MQMWYYFPVSKKMFYLLKVLYLYFLFPIQGYSKEKVPKGKSGPQPDLKIEKVYSFVLFHCFSNSLILKSS